MNVAGASGGRKLELEVAGGGPVRGAAELRGEESLPKFLAGLRRHTARTVGI